MRHATIRRTFQAKGLMEHLILLAFMTLTSSILMRAENRGDVLGQSLIWLAAGEILIQYLTRRRPRTRETRVVSRRPLHVREHVAPRVCQPL